MKGLLNLGLGSWVLLIFITVIKSKRMLNMQQHTECKMRYALAQGPPGLTEQPHTPPRGRGHCPSDLKVAGLPDLDPVQPALRFLLSSRDEISRSQRCPVKDGWLPRQGEVRHFGP